MSKEEKGEGGWGWEGWGGVGRESHGLNSYEMFPIFTGSACQEFRSVCSRFFPSHLSFLKTIIVTENLNFPALSVKVETSEHFQ